MGIKTKIKVYGRRGGEDSKGMNETAVCEAMDQLIQSLVANIWQTRWVEWIIYLLKDLDDIGDAATSAEVLTELQDSITTRLETGQW